MNSPRIRRLGLYACAVSFLFCGALAASAQAGTVPANLRVVTDTGKVLADVRQYTDTTAVPTSPQALCFIGGVGGSGKPATVFGPTALGSVADAAQSVPALNPILVTDEFSFGLGICGFGGVSAKSDFSNFWEVRVDHKVSSLSGDKAQVSSGDDVLWSLVPATFDPMFNPISEPELSLQAPARTTPGAPVTATVLEYSPAGFLRPAVGASVTGAASETDAQGHVQMSLAATATLTATRAGAIPSRSIGVCVKAKLKRCAPKRGLPIFGSELADKVGGTLGNDTIKARGGDDGISVRGRGRDKVQCGAGRDTVKADATDRVDKASCEQIDRPGGGKGKKR